MVDCVPFGDTLDMRGDPVEDVRMLEAELEKFSEDLAARERWLVLNKVDLLPEDERDAHCQDIVTSLEWQGPVFRISAINGLGTRELSYALMEHLEEKQRQATMPFI